MKKKTMTLCAFLSVLLMFSWAHAQEISVDVTNATIGATTNDTVKFRYTSAVAPWLGLNNDGKYWGEFKWDPFNYTLYPIAYGEETVAPPYAALHGTYSLAGFYVEFSDGRTFTEKDVAISGTMQIGTTTFNQSMVFGGNPTAVSGTYTTVFTKGTTTGVFTFRDTSGIHDGYFWITGYELSTFSGIMMLDSTTAFREWDYWVKVNNSITAGEFSAASQPRDLHNGASLTTGIGYLLHNQTDSQ